MRTTVVFAALLLAACAGDGQTAQPVLGSNMRRPARNLRSCRPRVRPSRPRRRAKALSLCQCGSREVGAPVSAAGLPNTQHPTLG